MKQSAGNRYVIPAALLVIVFTAGVGADSPRDDGHWSFRPVTRPAVPVSGIRTENGNAIDGFVTQRLQEEGLVASPPARPETLIRRVTLDLIGLPPTPAEVDAFLNDARPGRYERLVDRLLASPLYGERWARPWLDLCHYADTDGYLTDQLRPVAWRYRSWLVDALNANQPFDEFTIEQLAGDLVPNATLQQRLATGFLRQTLSNREGGAEPEEFRVKQVIDRTEMVGATWLGLTVGCARCHDHKYDPIEQREFFQLYACLNDADEINVDAPLPHEAAAFRTSRPEYIRQRNLLLDPHRKKLEGLLKRWEARCLNAWRNPGENHIWDRQWELVGLVWGGGLGEGQLEGQEIMKLSWPRRTARQRDDLLDYFLRSGSIVDEARFRELKLGELRDRLNALKSEMPSATRAPVMRAALTPRTTYIHDRGDFRDRGGDVIPATPAFLPRGIWGNDDPRLALAHWLVSTENPLTARVTINRMWEQFFGQGLVVTTEDFGTRSSDPSHLELLDWLASEFIHTEWDVKAMHRLIVCSATYRRSSEYRSELQTVDPQNALLARQNALRVSAETLRDAGLAVSGLLYTRMHGPAVRPPQSERVTMEGFGNHTWKPSSFPDQYRRGLYTFQIRTTPFAQGIIFDAPNPNEICTRRIRSNTPLQALTLLNDPVFFDMAEALGRRIRRNVSFDRARIERAFRLCFSRRPTAAESSRLLALLNEQRTTEGGSEDDAWTIVCSVLLNLHEFITRD